MRIERAGRDDTEAAMRLVSDVVGRLRRDGSDQWDERYPTAKLLAADIASGSLYVARERGELVALMSLDESQSAEYREVGWSTGSARALVVHRLAVSPDWQGRGVASAMMDYAEVKARREGYASVRLDAYTGNPAALALYEGRGYVKAGTVRFPWRSLPFNCYEKAL